MKTISLPFVTNKVLKGSDKKEGNLQYAVSNSILIIFTANGQSSKFHQVRKLQEKFQLDGKKVSFLYVLLKEEDRPDGALDDHMIAIDTKHIGMFGDIKDENVSRIVGSHYDFVITADLIPNIYSDYLLAKCKSNCKIGRFFDSHNKFYDLMIQTTEGSDLEFYLNQVYHYIKQL